MPQPPVAEHPGVELATDVLRAASSGLAATLPMTLAMLALHRAFPVERHRSLPPRLVTLRATEPTGLPRRLGPLGRGVLTTAGHFGYGAAAGSLYGAWERVVPGPPALNGALFGLAVWGASYQGWVPALGLMRPATRQPWARNAVMIGAHLVWGAVLGIALDRWRRASGRPGPDRSAEPPRRGIARPRLADRIKG